MKVKVIRVDGSVEDFEVIHKRAAMREIERRIGVSCFDSVNLRNGMVMLVDDTGMIDGNPVNEEATKLYWSVCKPNTTHQICGDVAIVNDRDFA